MVLSRQHTAGVLLVAAANDEGETIHTTQQYD
jgi:hypothetical protein